MDSFKAKEFWTVVVGGTTLSTIAGFINAISLAGLFTSTVSHVTGNVTRIGLTLLAGDFWQCAIISSLVLSFMAGSFTSGFMIGNSKFQLGRKYGFALLIEAGALILSYMLLRKEFVTGELLAAYACGLQNAMATSYSGAVLRTTHMTGICTDIGLILGQACSKRGTADTWKLKVFVPLFFGYVGGGILGQVSYRFAGDASLLIPSAILFSIAFFYLSWEPAKQAGQLLTQAVAKLQDEIEMGIHKFAPLLDKEEEDFKEPKWMEAARRAEEIDREIEKLMMDMDAKRMPATPRERGQSASNLI